MRSLAVKEPETFIWDAATDTPLKPGQYDRLDPQDPLTYRSYAHFPAPLPLDKLIALNEVQSMLSLGLESKEGALRTLGEEFPTEKLYEIRQELLDDARADGALKLIQTQIEQEIMQLTGTAMPEGASGMMQGAGGGTDGQTPIGAAMEKPLLDGADQVAQQGESALRNALVTEAYGTKIPQRRNVSKGY
jgi:hypothetical protein